MRLVGSTPFGSEATLDRAPWKGADGGLRCLAFSAYDYSMAATIDSDTIQRSARAGTMVNGIFITLATRNTGCRWRIYNTVFHPIIPHYAVFYPIIPALCQLRGRAYYAQNYAGIIAASLPVTGEDHGTKIRQ